MRVGEFLEETVLPALQERLDSAFPEFGWKRDALGWVATNQETTHSVLGVRADRVVAHGPAPPGFLIHGGDVIPWTAYLNGGQLPRGQRFVATVKELAERAGVDAAPLDRSQPRDRRLDLLHDFFTLCRIELRGEQGAQARGYLERRGLPSAAIDRSGLGLVPAVRDTQRLLEAAGYSELEIARSGVLADGRWPGRLCGAWRHEHGRIRTLWARTVHDSDLTARFLYLRGASRSGLPPYGVSEVLKLPLAERRKLVLVEGLLDVHHLRANGFANVAAVGGARVQPDAVTRLARHRVDTVVLAFDNDQPGRDGLARAIERVSRAAEAPALRVLDPAKLGNSKDPDEFVREQGIYEFRKLLDAADCAITWRALDHASHIRPSSGPHERRAALFSAGHWLGALPARLALEQEDAIHAVAKRCGYSPEAVGRSFRARFWPDQPDRSDRELQMGRTQQFEHSIDL